MAATMATMYVYTILQARQCRALHENEKKNFKNGSTKKKKKKQNWFAFGRIGSQLRGDFDGAGGGGGDDGGT